MKWPCGLSLGNVARSTRSTFAPCLASSIASDAPGAAGADDDDVGHGVSRTVEPGAFSDAYLLQGGVTLFDRAYAISCPRCSWR